RRTETVTSEVPLASIQPASTSRLVTPPVPRNSLLSSVVPATVSASTVSVVCMSASLHCGHDLDLRTEVDDGRLPLRAWDDASVDGHCHVGTRQVERVDDGGDGRGRRELCRFAVDVYGHLAGSRRSGHMVAAASGTGLRSM